MEERLVTNPDGSQGRIIHLDNEEFLRLCRPGAGADTCIWVVAGKGGFDCLFYNRRVPSITGEILEDRWKAGLTVAKRDGCEEVRAFKET
ncbi:hypothetical protein ES703_35066 [subsurface metagenome]